MTADHTTIRFSDSQIDPAFTSCTIRAEKMGVWENTIFQPDSYSLETRVGYTGNVLEAVLEMLLHV